MSAPDSCPDFSSLSNLVNKKVPADSYFEIPPWTTEFVLSELQTLKNSSAGSDIIGPNILKITEPAIVLSLSRILNASIIHGVFLALWEEAKVVIHHKSGNTSNKSNLDQFPYFPYYPKY